MSNTPKTRADCPATDQPCDNILCRYHLWVDDFHRQDGTPDSRKSRAWGDPSRTCALRFADRGPLTLEFVGRITGITRERIRQLEARAIREIRATDTSALRESLNGLNEPDMAEDIDITEDDTSEPEPATEYGFDQIKPMVYVRPDVPTAHAARMREARRKKALERDANPSRVCQFCGCPVPVGWFYCVAHRRRNGALSADVIKAIRADADAHNGTHKEIGARYGVTADRVQQIASRCRSTWVDKR